MCVCVWGGGGGRGGIRRGERFSLSLCVCVCVREREREGDGRTDRQTDRALPNDAIKIVRDIKITYIFLNRCLPKDVILAMTFDFFPHPAFNVSTKHGQLGTKIDEKISG